MVDFGLHVNNRLPFLSESFTPSDLLELAVQAEELGLHSVWLGDSLTEKPRLEAVATLSSIAAVTESLGLGTTCLISSLRHPVQLANAWATLDMLSEGRTIMGACMGNSRSTNRKQHELVGVPPERRRIAFEEGIEVMRALWRDGEVSYDGELYSFDGVSFDTGNEVTPYRPVQDPPPVLITSNPRGPNKEQIMERAAERIVRYADGWMTTNRTPEEFATQLDAIHAAAERAGRDPAEFTVAYLATLSVGPSKAAAEAEMREYLAGYYPHFDPASDDLGEWGPAGSPDEVIDWLETYAELGCDVFMVRIASPNQQDQLERFVDGVLPAF